MYDARLGRWFCVDLLAEEYLNQSPYGYVSNNPLGYIDPNGLFETRFGAWWYGLWHGGGDVLRDSEGEWFLSQTVDDTYGDGVVGITIKRIFGWGGRTATWGIENIEVLRLKLHQLDIDRNLREAGIEFSYTDDIDEARCSWLKLSTSVVLPTVISYGTTAANAAKTTNATSNVVAAKTAGSGAQYSVAFETKLANNLYPGKGYYAHFKAANTALSKTMASDAAFAKSMSELGITIPRAWTGNILGKSPANWVWHHDINTGVMQLVPKGQHTLGIPFWNTMHPGGIGGMSIWGK